MKSFRRSWSAIELWFQRLFQFSNKSGKTFFTSLRVSLGFETNIGSMRIPFKIAASLTVIGIFSSGCAGPEQKFGRGVNNVTEFARMGEIRRSMEQTALWDSPEQAYTLGFMRG